MGGVDLLDSLIGRYKIKMRTKKWYMRLWYHLIDVTVVNAWLLYRRVEMSKGNIPKITLFDFRSEVAFSLTKTNALATPKRGRPSLMVETQIAAKRIRPHTSKLPSIDVRKDSLDHWPDFKETRQRCKMPGCGKLTSCTCTKCDNYFCYGVNRNCFILFFTLIKKKKNHLFLFLTRYFYFY